MLFIVTQTHTPEACPKDEGGSDILVDRGAQGVRVKGIYGAWYGHTIWYVLEADGAEEVQKFLDPGMKRCTATVTPVFDATAGGRA